MVLNASIRNHGNEKLGEIARYIKKELMDIKATLIHTENSKIFKKEYCTNLRMLLQLYQDEYNRNVSKIEKIDWMNAQAEPLDFLRFLDIVFIIRNELKYRTESWGTNLEKKVTPKVMQKVSEKTIKTSIIDIIDIDILLSSDEYDLSKRYPQKTHETFFDKNNLWKLSSKHEGFKRRFEKITYLSTRLLITHVSRVYFGGKLYTKVIPPLRIKLKENLRNIYLRSMIIHHGEDNGGHYTCLYECNGQWYHYDDTNAKIKHVGDFEIVKGYKYGYYLKNVSDLIYW